MSHTFIDRMIATCRRYGPLLFCWQMRLATGLAALVYTLALLGLGATPMAVDVANPPWDKVLHFAAYAVLASLISISQGGSRPLHATLLTLLVAAADESLQMLEPGRFPGLDDFAADALAAVLAALLIRAIHTHAQAA